jgi:zinc protease
VEPDESFSRNEVCKMKSTGKKALSVCIVGLLCGFMARAQDSAKPAAAPASATEAAGATQAAAAVPSADQVLDHYVQAIGGRAAWMKLTSRVSKGTIEIPAMENLSGTLEIHEKAPNCMLAVINLGGGVFRQGFDGTVAWSDNPRDGLRVLTGGELEDARREASFYHPLELQKNYTKLTVSGIERVNEHDTYVVVGVREKGAPDKMYFDVQSGLLVRSVNQRYTPDGLTEFQADVDDYTALDGVKLPFTVRQSGGGSAFVIHFTEVQHNLQLTVAQFAMPAAEPPADTPAAPTEKQPE